MSDVRNQSSVDTEVRSQPTGTPPRDEATAVPRLLDLPVGQVLWNADSALSIARQRVTAERARGDQNYAAHGSSPAPQPGAAPPLPATPH
ncbi:hypothetical protein [Actinoplanes solisilvae]|uniref:hypothetical protein n=1 Tax=Actinoplanes solisilvae TaxID=2486853 RepID=UPI000FD8E555|nr:hypothetical protein [Actinoplanes solisilvae]